MIKKHTHIHQIHNPHIAQIVIRNSDDDSLDGTQVILLACLSCISHSGNIT